MSELMIKIKDFRRSFADLMDEIEILVKTYEINISNPAAPLGPQEKPEEEAGGSIILSSDDCGAMSEADIQMMLEGLAMFQNAYK